MKTKFLLILLLLLPAFFLIVPRSNAQTTLGSKDIKPTIRQQKTTLQNNIQNTKKELTEEKKTLTQLVQERRKEATQSSSIIRETFQKRLQEIKDERKKLVIQRIDERISILNEEYAQKLVAVIEKLKDILARIEQKAGTAKTEGKDTASVEAAIATAKTALDDAQRAVIEQSGEVYTINVSSNEASLKTNAGETVSKFRADLKNTHKIVIEAKQAVMKAASEMARLVNAKGIFNPAKSATSSAQ